MTSDAKAPNGKPSISDVEIIERFGGIRPMASKLGVAVTTVQGWKERDHIPKGRLEQIIAAAADLGVDLGLEMESATESAPTTEKQPAPAPARRETPTEAAPEPAPEPKPTPEPVIETTPAAAKAAAPPRPAGGVSWSALIVVVLLLGGTILTRPLWEPELYPGGGGGFAPADTGRLDGIAADLAAIETAMKDLGRELNAGSRKLSGRIDALEAGGGESGAAFAAQLADIEQAMNALSGKLNAGRSSIESRVATLEANEDEVPERVTARLLAIDAAIDALTRSARALEGGLAAVGGTAGNLEGRVTELETRPLQTGEKIAAMVLALGQVEAAMNSGRPYRAALNRLEALGRDDPLILEGGAVAALSPWADYGIPDRLALRLKFAELAPEIDRALSGAGEGNWLDGIWNSVTGLVTIRRIDGSDLPPIGRAEQAMDNGDLATAVAAFAGERSLGPEGDAWLNLVKARIDSEREIDALYGQMIAPLAGAGQAGASGQ